MKTINEHLKFCNINIEYQLSYIIVNDKGMEEFYIGSKIYSKVQCERLHIKHKGRYIKYIHRGEYVLKKIYSEVTKFAEKKGIIIGENTYESEISIYRDIDSKDYMT